MFAKSGSIADLMQPWNDGRFELAASQEILVELYPVFLKPSIQKHFKSSEYVIVEYIDTIKQRAIITPNINKTDRIKSDLSDNKFLACAVDVRADFIVSEGKHLKEIKDFHGIKIVDAKTFVETIKRGGRNPWSWKCKPVPNHKQSNLIKSFKGTVLTCLYSPAPLNCSLDRTGF